MNALLVICRVKGLCILRWLESSRVRESIKYSLMLKLGGDEVHVVQMKWG
jgi:hypothetical protein